MLRTPPGAVVIRLCSSRLSSAGTFTRYRGQASPRILERALLFRLWDPWLGCPECMLRGGGQPVLVLTW